MSQAGLYVMIPTHGRAPLLRRTLASLAECALPESFAETIVVENGPKSGAESFVVAADRRLRARYMHVEEANKSNALNEAIKTVPDDGLVVFFDDDVRFAPHVLAAYAEAAQRGPGHFFGGPVEVDYETPPPEHVRKLLPPSGKGWRPKNEADLKRFGFLGANWAAFVRDLAEAGNFNVSLGPGRASTGQESEMQWRLRQKGMQMAYLESALIWHFVPAERCSVEWLYNRAHRLGTSRGRLRRQEGGIRLKSVGYVTLHYVQALARRISKAGKPIEQRLASEINLIEQTANLKGYFGNPS